MKHKKGLGAIIFCMGLALFAFSLMPVFRDFTKTFWIATICGAVMMVSAAALIFYKPKPKTTLSSKYERKGNLISRSEYNFLLVLRSIEPEKYEVLPQIALASVIDKKTNNSYRNELFRICDYCFVDRDTFEPLLLVELNDSSHERADRRERDEKVNAICKNARMPIVTFKTTDDLSFHAVKKIVLKNIPKR